MIHSLTNKNINVIVDIGIFKSCIGLGGGQAPQVATYSHLVKDTNLKQDNYFVGNDTLNQQRTDYQVLSLHNKKGEDYQLDYDCHYWKNLNLKGENVSVLIAQDVEQTSKIHETNKRRQKIGQIMLQQLETKNICFVKKPVLSTFSLGRTSAVIIDSGYSATRASVVHDGFCVNNLLVKYGGHTIDQLIKQKIGKQIKLPQQQTSQPFKQSFINFHRQIQISRIKQSFPSDYQPGSHKMKDSQYTDRIQYTLPDGAQIRMNRNQLVDPFINYPHFWKKYIHIFEDSKNDLLPNVSIAWKSNQWYRSLAGMGIQVVNNFISELLPQQQKDMKQEMLNNVALVGGNFNFADISTGTIQQLEQKQPRSKTILSIANNNKHKNSSSWVGGSIISEMPSFLPFWISQIQWKESGAKAIEQSTYEPIKENTQQSCTTINFGALGVPPSNISQNKVHLSQEEIASIVKYSKINLINKRCP